MRQLFIAALCLLLLVLVSCSAESDSNAPEPEGETSAEVPAGELAEEPPLIEKPSGVRYQELKVGPGKEIVNGMFVRYEYSVWFADLEGTVKRELFHSSAANQQPYFGQVGVTPLPALSDGLLGMHEGGTRRIFIPAQQGYNKESPFAGNNLIFEIDAIREVSEDAVRAYQDGFNRLAREKAQARDSSGAGE